MNQCSLCMTENHEQATVCKACGAMKMLVRQRAGFLRGLGILGFSVIGMLPLMAGKFLIGFGFIAVAAFLGFTIPQKLMWVKHTLVP
jgi:hypothetical protein